MMMWPFPDDGSFTRGRSGFPAADDPDVRLTYAVADRLLSDSRIRHQRVTVEVQNRVVLLGGTVDSRSAGKATVEAARGVAGVVDVCNGLRVTGTSTAEDPASAGQDRTTPATADDDLFEGIVEGLRITDPRESGLRSSASRHRWVLWGALAAIVWALLSVLMVVSGWAALAVGCALVGLAFTLVRPRRSGRRNGLPAPRR